MHPRLQPLPHLLQISPHPLSQHAEQQARLPRRLHHPLAPGPADLIVRCERVGDVLGIVDAAEQSFEHEGVFDRLSGALALVGSCGVGGVAHHGDVADGVCGGGEVVAHGPSG